MEKHNDKNLLQIKYKDIILSQLNQQMNEDLLHLFGIYLKYSY